MGSATMVATCAIQAVFVQPVRRTPLHELAAAALLRFATKEHIQRGGHVRAQIESFSERRYRSRAKVAAACVAQLSSRDQRRFADSLHTSDSNVVWVHISSTTSSCRRPHSRLSASHLNNSRRPHPSPCPSAPISPFSPSIPPSPPPFPTHHDRFQHHCISFSPSPASQILIPFHFHLQNYRPPSTALPLRCRRTFPCLRT